MSHGKFAQTRDGLIATLLAYAPLKAWLDLHGVKLFLLRGRNDAATRESDQFPGNGFGADQLPALFAKMAHWKMDWASSTNATFVYDLEFGFGLSWNGKDIEDVDDFQQHVAVALGKAHFTPPAGGRLGLAWVVRATAESADADELFKDLKQFLPGSTFAAGMIVSVKIQISPSQE